MDKIGLYLGCVIPTEQYGYEMSLREVIPKLGIDLVDVENVSCCGGPLRGINLFITLYLSARNMAIYEKAGVDILAPCPYCHLALSEAKRSLETSPDVKERVNAMLETEGLKYEGKSKIYHTLDLLHDVIGIEEIKKVVEKPLEGKKIAAHYGCHLIRPHDIPRPDDSERPTKLEALLEAIGASTEDYNEKLNCCGAQIMITYPESALTKTGQKLKAVQDRGFSALAHFCPWGQRMMDAKQEDAAQTVGASLNVPVLYYTQLLGLAMGIEVSKLGLDMNLSPVDTVIDGGGE